MTTDTPHIAPHTTIPSPAPAAGTPSTRGRPRVGRIVVGVVIGLVAAALSLGGGASLWANAQKDDDGFLTTGTHTYTAGPASSALISDTMDIDLDGAESLVDDTDLGELRLDVGAGGGKPVFAGVARTQDVERYLAGVGTTTVTDVHFGPFDADYDEQRGGRPATPPAARDIWAATANADGQLDWTVENGDWTIVVMNRDGSRGVSAEIEAGAKVPFLGPLGWTLLGGGAILLAGAAALIITGSRRRDA